MKYGIILLLLLLTWQNTSFASSMSNDTFQITQDENAEPIKTAAPKTQDKKESDRKTVFYSSLFTIDSSIDFIDYGKLYPTEPVLRNLTVSALSEWPLGFYVSTFQNHSLESSTSAIADTSCDNGSCTSTLASSWNRILTYGFGYQCKEGKNSFCAYRNEADDFLPFADFSAMGNIPLFYSLAPKQLSQASTILKINISKSQSKEIYQNNIYFVAIPRL